MLLLIEESVEFTDALDDVETLREVEDGTV